MWGDVQRSGKTDVANIRNCPVEMRQLRQRNLAEDFLNAPQVAHSGLCRTTDPAAHCFHRNTQLAGCGFLGQPFAAKSARHPFGERLGWATLILFSGALSSRSGISGRIRRDRVQRWRRFARTSWLY
jgi:hypothetical protein